MPVRGEDCTGYNIWIRNTETGEEYPFDGMPEVSVVTTSGYLNNNVGDIDGTTADYQENERNIGITSAYRGIPVNERGICQNEQCLPNNPERGDMWRIQDSGNRWLWTGEQWELIGIEDTWRADTTPIGNEQAPVLVNGEYLYIPDAFSGTVAVRRGEDERWQEIPAERLGIQNPLREAPHDAIGYTWGEGGRIEYIDTSGISFKPMDNDNTTDTPQEAFEEIFEVGA